MCGRHLPATFDDLLQSAAQFPLLLRALEELKRAAAAPLADFLAELYDCRNPAPAAPGTYFYGLGVAWPGAP